jgi:hypothetical protein
VSAVVWFKARVGQPFEQESQILGSNVSAGQKSAQIKIGRPKTNVQIGISLYSLL